MRTASSAKMTARCFDDVGGGLAIGYRPAESLGVELSYAQFSQNHASSTPDRLNNPLQAVGQVYLFPWTRVSPFVSAGYSWNTVDFDDNCRAEGEERVAQFIIASDDAASLGDYSFNIHLSANSEDNFDNFEQISPNFGKVCQSLPNLGEVLLNFV